MTYFPGACIASAIAFTGEPPRGAEFGLAEMAAAGAHLARYTVGRVA